MTHELYIALGELYDNRLAGTGSDQEKAERIAKQCMVGAVARRFGVDPAKISVHAEEPEKKDYKITVVFSWPDEPPAHEIAVGRLVETAVQRFRVNGDIDDVTIQGEVEHLDKFFGAATVRWQTGELQTVPLQDLKLVHQ